MTDQQRSPLPGLLLMLSITTGLVDAASILGLGKVFTANMTGNIVFLGFATVGTPGFGVLPYVTALLAFFLGALIAGRAGKWFEHVPVRSWLLSAALFELILFWISAALALYYDVAAAEPKAILFTIIALTAVAMGFRNGTVRQLKVPDLTTTVLTLTVTGLAADSSLSGGNNPNMGRRIGSVIAIFGGAAAGAALTLMFGITAPLFVAGLVVFGGTLFCTRRADA